MCVCVCIYLLYRNINKNMRLMYVRFTILLDAFYGMCFVVRLEKKKIERIEMHATTKTTQTYKPSNLI